MKKRKIPAKIIICGLICLTILELAALSQGINGVLLRIVMGIIGAAIGTALPIKVRL